MQIPNDNDYTLEKIFTYGHMKKAFHKCRLGKLWKDSVLREYISEEDFIFDTQIEILEGTFRFSKLWHTEIMERGKKRLLSTLTIKDRFVCKVLNNYFLLEYYRPRLIKENCATLENRGTLYALNILKRQMQSISSKYGMDFYILKLDIKSYFDNIPHEYCMKLVKHATSNKDIIRLFELMFEVSYYDDFIHNGEHAPYGVGLGGEIPQTFGVIVLNELDHLLKEKYHIKYYVRYMDDIIIMHQDKDYLNYVMITVENYLHTVLELELNKKKSQLKPAKEGVIFLKFHFYPNKDTSVSILKSKESIHKEKRKLRKFKKKLKENLITYDDIENHYLSHRAHNSIVTSKEVIKRLDEYYCILFADYYLEHGHFKFEK